MISSLEVTFTGLETLQQFYVPASLKYGNPRYHAQSVDRRWFFIGD